LSPGFARVVLRGLAKERSQRPANARAFVAELQAACADDRRQRWWRNRWLQGVAATYLTVGLIALAASAAGERPRPVAPAPATMASSGVPPVGAPMPAAAVALRGSVLDAIDGRVPTVQRAVLTAVRRRGLTVARQDQDAGVASIEASFTTGEPVRVTLSQLTADATQVEVQVGRFGDEARSRQLLGWIRDEF
jgi:hypothetical protein